MKLKERIEPEYNERIRSLACADERGRKFAHCGGIIGLSVAVASWPLKDVMNEEDERLL